MAAANAPADRRANQVLAPRPHTAGSREQGAPTAPPANWEFYRPDEPAKTPELEPAPKAASRSRSRRLPLQRRAQPAPAKAPAAAAAPAPRTAAPRTPAPSGSALIPKGAITLQVAALLREADALALAQALQEKKFPAIVTTPSTDKYYRVQVGPYADTKSATAARRELEKQGFKTIVRR